MNLEVAEVMCGVVPMQAIKRLLTFMQRRFPTDPSRSVDFDGHRDAAYGAAGAGSDKLVRVIHPCEL